MWRYYKADFIKDTLKRIAVTAGLIGCVIALSMVPFENKDLKHIFSFVVGFIAGCPLGLYWLDWWNEWR